MRVLVETKGMDQGEWLQYRKQGLGGSDAAAIVGANKYTSKLVLYMEKVGIYEKVVDSEAAFWGNELEDTIARNFIKRYNQELFDEAVRRNEYISELVKDIPPLARIQRRNAILMHDKHDFMLANIDRLLFCPVKGNGLLEVKTASQYLADEWKGDDVPDAYFIQVQHYLAITGLSYGYIAVLIGGQKLKYYYIPRDQEFIDNLIALEVAFWYNHVVPQVPPEVDGSDSTTEMYKLLYPTSYEGNTLELPSTAIEWVEQREHFKNLEEESKEEKRRFENLLKDALKENDTAFAGPHKITWKTAKNGVRSMRITMKK
jgi:predicted phage-related endonuclease